ncbi:MAG: hypothetical protein ACYS0E_05590 [Planctomycetota bacterium]
MALISWLKSKKRKPPMRLDGPPQETDGGVDVKPAFDAGSIMVQRGDRLVTLHWTKDDKDRRRRLPAGEYLLRTTRLEREKEGAWWFLSSTGPAKQKVRVAKRTKLKIDDTVHFRSIARRRGSKLQLGFGITTKDKRGLSVYRDGKRVPVKYKLFDKKGKVLASGTMNYG